jgi:hypothetical protein
MPDAGLEVWRKYDMDVPGPTERPDIRYLGTDPLPPGSRSGGNRSMIQT